MKKKKYNSLHGITYIFIFYKNKKNCNYLVEHFSKHSQVLPIQVKHSDSTYYRYFYCLYFKLVSITLVSSLLCENTACSSAKKSQNFCHVTWSVTLQLQFLNEICRTLSFWLNILILCSDSKNVYLQNGTPQTTTLTLQFLARLWHTFQTHWKVLWLKELKMKKLGFSKIVIPLKNVNKRYDLIWGAAFCYLWTEPG